MRLSDKVAIVTGAAGAGIGQATARALVREGASVVISDAHAKRLFSVAKEIMEISEETLKAFRDALMRRIKPKVKVVVLDTSLQDPLYAKKCIYII